MVVEAAAVIKERAGISPLTLLILALACLVLYLPGFFTLPPIDRDEPRFAQASKQMVETGDYVDIRFQDEPRYKKPIGIYWLQVAAVELVGLGADSPIWVYRLPSLLGAILAVLLTALVGARLFDRSTGVIAALLLASSLLMGAEARLAKTDAVLLACIMAAQLALARAWNERDSTENSTLLPVLGFWLALGAGMLVKGPIILLASGGTALLLSLFTRRGRWLLRLKPALGVPLAVLVVLPWLLAIGLQSDGAFFQASVGHDLLGKVFSGQESHGAPPGYYAVAVWLTFWPGSLLLFLALPWIWNNRRDPSVMFCLAWILPVWIVFELVLTKLPHYVLPAYPALAILTARALADGLPAPGSATPGARWAGRLRRLVVPVWILVTVGLVAAFVAAVWTGAKSDPRLSYPSAAFGLAVLLLPPTIKFCRHFRAFRRLYRRRGFRTSLKALLTCRRLGPRLWLGAVLTGAAFAVMVHVLFYVQFAYKLETLWPSARAAELVDRTVPWCPGLSVAVAGYAEPSVVFLLGTRTKLTDAEGAAANVMRGDCNLALVEKREELAFFVALPDIGSTVFELGRISGFNYSNGRFVELTLYGRR